MFAQDFGSTPHSAPPSANKTDELLFPGPREPMVSHSHTQFTEMGSFSQPKSNSTTTPRGGLVERMAARAGFNAPRLNTESIRSSDLSLPSQTPSPYLTIPPGLSPTTLLDSPVFLSNSLAQPSPTTGKFPFFPNGNSKSSTLILEASDKNKNNFFEDINASSFAFKPVTNASSSFFLGAASKLTSAALPQQPLPSIEVSVQSENSPPGLEPTGVENQTKDNLQLPADFPHASVEKDYGSNTMSTDQKAFDNAGGSAANSPPLNEQADEGDQKGSGDYSAGGGGATTSEDGYNWRKYGQKQVKGSEYPRSYYKCTHPNCQVKKKVERSHEGHITEIIYKGAHNHPKPPNRRSAIGSSNSLADMRMDIPEQAGLQSGGDGDPVWASTQKGTVDWRYDNLEVTSSASVGPEYCNQSTSLQAQNGTQLESGDAVDASSTFSNDEDEDDRGTHGSVSLGYDGEEDESESKRRKLEAYASATEMSGATRAIREPRVVVQTTSEVDILDDGYRWRKYGQKVVKGNPNPRSYYKCTNAGCTVRKHVERASHDLKSVITTYEGKHNHDVPAARNSSHVNSGPSGNIPVQASAAAAAVQSHVNVHRPEQSSQVHNGMARFERPATLGSFALPGAAARQQLVPNSHGFSFGMNQPGLANLTMAGLGPAQPKLPVLSVHPYLAQQRQMHEMGFMLPKGEPKAEPISESGLNLSNGSVYQQIMSRLPLGPQM
ncbi:WRKY domain containing protein [Parasponia andersonii]|uniref:WRKY domain containing protein n=1 Tax=Parasponia andersonii TaxID=3476 RepID=A0A2P5BEG6_PARAD|nr:WRKY domain containing protein [Parasponia andersonii]